MKDFLKRSAVIGRTIKSSLAMAIPVLFIGSITVLLNGIPIQAYQDFIASFLGGAIKNIGEIMQLATVGILAIHITIALNFSYMNQTQEGPRLVFRLGSLMSCLAGFFILVGFFSGDSSFSMLSGQGVFSALLAGIIGSVLFQKFGNLFRTPKMIFVDGADSEFNAALHVILPFVCTTVCFAALNHIITVCFEVESVQHLFMKVMDALFASMYRSYSSGLLFTTLTSIMWWFGIHGNNVLHQVATDLFTEIIPGEIVSKSFIDTFVNMGGTGCTIGLLAAMMVFGKRSSTRKLSKMALIPSLFNIGELMVFGFPVIYNPTMIVPFIMAPILCFSNAFILTRTGLLPLVVNEVVWTTPPLLSGYMATGSARGVIVQFLNILLSMACYAPFIVMYEKKAVNEFSSALDGLTGMIKKREETGEKVILMQAEGNIGRLAKLMAADLEEALSSSSPSSDSQAEAHDNPLLLKYQPQFDNNGRCIGAEALLRWQHARYGTVYPPLVIQEAKESGILFNLEKYVIEKAVHDSESLRKHFGADFKMSVNVTVSTLYDTRLIPFLQDLADRYRLKAGNICLEITEETELVTSEETGDLIRSLKAFGYTFALDDFSMGHTSLHYLQHNQFDIVKLDGSLVRSLIDNERTREIISSIVYLSKSLDFAVIAEYVETAEQKEALEQVGCLRYQGYLFSPAVDREALLSMEPVKGSKKTK